MRIAVLMVALALAAGCTACSAAPTGQPSLTPIPPKSTVTSAPSTAIQLELQQLLAAELTEMQDGGEISSEEIRMRAASRPALRAPPIETVMAWVAAGVEADPGTFHTASREGATTQLGEDIAFVTPSGSTECMTEEKFDGALACLVDLSHPPAEPSDSYGHWIGGWVDFDGTTLDIGSSRADPGRFAAGTGAVLPYGSTLRFGDYQCRSDAAGVFCVNFAHRSGAKFADSGVEPLGCLKLVDDPGLGMKFSC